MPVMMHAAAFVIYRYKASVKTMNDTKKIRFANVEMFLLQNLRMRQKASTRWKCLVVTYIISCLVQ